ncbi:MAG: Crp/Fnr family transcriptional regulator [Burkholderiales bacterium]|nr:Crp/Fnr family transcriptional regulator [Burkholderiales bacterium]
MIAAAARNRLLDALPALELARLRVALDLVGLRRGDVLFDAGVELRYAYFPVTAVVCLLCLFESGLSTGVALVGNEGMVDVALLLGGATAASRAVVRGAGFAYRLSSRLLRAEFGRGEALHDVLLGYLGTRMAEAQQAAACNRHHTLEQRLSRLLLESADRSPGAALTMTHENIAGLLGVRREGVTGAALSLHAAGAIAYRRGRIAVLDRDALAARACECYHAPGRVPEQAGAAKPRSDLLAS